MKVSTFLWFRSERSWTTTNGIFHGFSNFFESHMLSWTMSAVTVDISLHIIGGQGMLSLLWLSGCMNCSGLINVVFSIKILVCIWSPSHFVNVIIDEFCCHYLGQTTRKKGCGVKIHRTRTLHDTCIAVLHFTLTIKPSTLSKYSQCTASPRRL